MSRYTVFLADTEESKEMHFRLRHEVLCDYEQWTGVRSRGGLEYDDYDSQAAHFLIRDNRCMRWVAAWRLVVGRLDFLPISRLSEIAACGLSPGANRNVAELSRFLIVGGYRKSKAPQSSFSVGNEPVVMLSLIHTVVEYCAQHQIEYVFALSKRALAFVFANHGVPMAQIGPRCDMDGYRYPYRIDLSEIRSPVSMWEGMDTRKYYKASEFMEPARKVANY